LEKNETAVVKTIDFAAQGCSGKCIGVQIMKNRRPKITVLLYLADALYPAQVRSIVACMRQMRQSW